MKAGNRPFLTGDDGKLNVPGPLFVHGAHGTDSMMLWLNHQCVDMDIGDTKFLAEFNSNQSMSERMP